MNALTGSVKVCILFCRATLKDLCLSADDINNATNKLLELNGKLRNKQCLMYFTVDAKCRISVFRVLKCPVF